MALLLRLAASRVQAGAPAVCRMTSTLAIAEEGNKRSQSNQAVVPAGEDHEILSPALTGNPVEQLKTRVVRITEPATKVTQSGSFAPRGAYQLAWDTQERWENPLMGWASNADPMSNLRLEFKTLESAVSFVEKNGWSYYVHSQPKKKFVAGKKADYGANFSWSKRTRNSTK